MRHHLRLIIFLFLGILAVGCGGKKETLISGKTMGTTYHIKVVTGAFQNIGNLEQQIERSLEAINQSMSTYRKDSEISRFNALSSTDEKFRVSEDFLAVMRVAEKLHQLTNGAWDGTISPLIRVWGFRKKERQQSIPGPEAIQQLLATIGFDQIEILETGDLRKKNASVSLDLASIAKGYGVDQVAAVIEKNGFRDFLVEIGGEVYASGLRKDGKPWKVGINTPRKEAALNAVYKALDIKDKGFATSGDYRNFFEMNGKRYSHILDPITGYPVDNGVVSASVLADTCTFADGLATALMVLGYERGIALVSSLEGVECLIVVQQADGTLRDYASEGFGI